MCLDYLSSVCDVNCENLLQGFYQEEQENMRLLTLLKLYVDMHCIALGMKNL